MKNTNYTFVLFGKYHVGINKFLLPIKISLFFWFAGSHTSVAFISVYLKHQGLTLTHLSVMVTISAAFQFIVGIITGMLADRIGRVKPFLFIFGSIFLTSLICFIVMPKLNDCDTRNITFHCINERFTAQDYCHISQDIFDTDSCSLIFSENSTHSDENENFLFISMLLQMKFSTERYHKNETSGFCRYEVYFKNYSSKSIPPCEIQKCETFHMVCSKKTTFSDCVKSKSFWILVYGILVVINFTFQTNIFRLFDVITMDLCNQYNSDFGKQRLWSIFGSSVGPSLTGFISHKISSNESDKSYDTVFVCSAIFSTLAFIPVWNVNPKFHKPAETVWKKSLELVMNLEIIMFLFLLLTQGLTFAFIIIYGNWYLQDLGATNLLLGVSTGVSAAFGVPFLYISKWLFNKIGLRNFFVLGLLSYAIYSFAYSLMREPWLAVGIELLKIIAYHLFWAASIQYCDEIAPVELQATMKVLSGTIHYNIARLGATTIGGYVMNKFGGRVAFRMIGSLAFGYAVIYGIYLTIQRKKTTFQKKESGVQEDSDDCETKMCIK